MDDARGATRQSDLRRPARGLPFGLMLGIALGMAVGAAQDNAAIGVSLAITFDITFSIIFGAAKARTSKTNQDAAADGDASDEEKS